MGRCTYVGPRSDTVLCRARHAIFTPSIDPGCASGKERNCSKWAHGIFSISPRENMKTRRGGNHRVVILALALSTGYDIPGSCIRRRAIQSQTSFPPLVGL